MNKDMIERVAKRLDGAKDIGWRERAKPDKVQYDQSRYFFDCGTPACVAGHALAEVGGYSYSEGVLRDKNGGVCHPEDAAAKELGLGAGVATDLFEGCPYGNQVYAKTPTAADAAACLRGLAETGEVQWE